MHVLPNGLTVAVDPLPGAEIGRARPLCDGRLALRAGASQRPRPRRRAYGVQGRGRARHARARRSDRGCRRRNSTPGPRATRPSSTAARWPRTRRCWPSSSPISCAPAPRGRASRARERRWSCPNLAKRRFARRPRPRSSVRSRRSPTSRSAARSSARDETFARRSRADDCRDWLRDEIVPSRLIVSASGKVEPDEILKLAERLFGDMADWRAGPDRPRRIHRRRAQRPARVRAGALCLRSSGRCRADPRVSGAVAVRAGARRRHRRRGCSRSCVRSAASLIRSARGSQAYADTGLVAFSCAADRARAVEVDRTRATRSCATVESLTERELERARAQLEAGLLMRLESRRAGPTTWRGRSRCSAESCRARASCSASSRRRRSKQARAARARRCSTAARAVASVGAQLALRGVSDLTTIVAEPWADWGLIDCGNGQKLERYGDYHGRSARAAGDVGAGARRLGSRRDLRARLR